MADNVAPEAVVSAAAFTFATDDISTVHYPISKLAYGALDSATIVSTSNGLPVAQQGTWNIGTVTTVTTVSTVSALGNSTTGPQKAEDVASANADVGIPAMAVQKATPANTAGTDGDYEFLQMSAGRLWTSTTVTGTVTVDGSGVTQPVSNAGLTALNGAISGTEVQVDVLTLPALAAGTNNIGDVDVLSIVPGTGATNLGKAEDAAHSTGDVGVMALAVRQDTAAATSGTDGDYQPIISDSSGRLHVNVGNTVTVASHAVTNAGTFATQIDGAALTALQLIDDVVFAEDVASQAADKGIQVLTVRKDTAAATSGTDGDYQPPVSNARGATWVAIEDGAGGQITSFGGGTQYTEDAAAAANPVGTAQILVRADTPSAIASADGDNVAQRGTDYGAAYVTLLDTGGTPVSVGGGTQYTEDAAAAANPVGNAINLIRADTPAGVASADGDNLALRGTNYGAAYVTLLDTGGTAVSVGGGTQYDEDAAHSTGAKVTLAGVVRQDTAANLAGTDGDYSVLVNDANGRLHVNVGNTVTVASHAVTNAGTFAVQVDGAALTALQLIDDAIFAEDVAAQAADKGISILAVRRDTPSSLVGADNDYINLTTDSSGRLWTHDDVLDAALAGSELQVDVVASLPAGTNNIGDVDVLSVVPGTGATALGKAEDGAHTTGDTGVYMLAVRDDSLAAHSGTDGDYESLHTNADGALWVSLAPSATGGLSIFKSIDIDESEEEVKATAGVLHSITAFNRTAAPVYLKFYNLTAANTTVGTSTPVATFVVPANADSDGAGFVWNNEMGLGFSTAISVAATTGVADSDTGAPGANDCVIVLGYK